MGNQRRTFLNILFDIGRYGYNHNLNWLGKACSFCTGNILAFKFKQAVCKSLWRKGEHIRAIRSFRTIDRFIYLTTSVIF